MAGKGRGYGQNNDWDPMRDDYNNSMHDSQYPDEDSSGGRQLDPCRLYITNIPKNLTQAGLRSTFSKFGTLCEAFVSSNPSKNFALLKFETPGEAKYAMTKMNHTPPLNLNIAIAHQPPKKDRERNNTSDRNSYRDDASMSSRGHNNYRNQNDLTNCNSMDDMPVDDEMGLEDTLDPELHLELENLKLEQLKVREEQLQCKHRMLLLKQADKRSSSHNASNIHCVLPNGRIVVRNTNNERSTESRDGDVSFGAGAGDSLTIPGLQREWSTACVWCGARADTYCARCGLAPYCSVACQQRDWRERHRAVCHNLARLKTGNGEAISDNAESVMTTAPSLRQPHPPGNQAAKREPVRHDDGTGDTYQKPKQSLRQPVRGPRDGRGGFNNNRPVDTKRPPLRHEKSTEDEEVWDNVNRTPAGDCKPSHVNVPAREPPRPVSQQEPLPLMREPKRVMKEPLPMMREPKPVAKDPIPVMREPKPVVKDPIPVMREPKPVIKDPVPVMKEPMVMKESEVIKAKPPASVNDVTPGKKIVPKNYLMQKLSIGDSAIISVETKASDCRTKKPGFICVTVHKSYETEFQALCDQYALDCEADDTEYATTPGETFSYLNTEDGGWYRARCLTPTLAALLDSGRVVTLRAADKCRRLPNAYEAMPEFCCVLNAESIQLGESLKCTIKSKIGDGYKVDIENIETGASMGSGDVTRWLPEVDYPVASVSSVPNNTVPEVSRPEVTNGSRVLLVDASSPVRAFVRPADDASQKLFESILQDVVLYARNATPLKEPPQKGQTVIALYEDGMHYRALCKRTNVKQNKYLLEYIEFGNTEVSSLDKLYPCPPQLTEALAPAQSSLVALSADTTALTPPAVDYLDRLKDGTIELSLTIPSGAKTAPSGSQVILTIVKNNENVNSKLTEMCKPDWKKLEEQGVDVIETERLMHSILKYVPLPTRGGLLTVLDVSALAEGSMAACPANLPHAEYVFNTLTEKMGEYCSSDIGMEPYLPNAEELCIAQCPPFTQWFRAILLELPSGPGSAEARLCFIDYGNVELVPVSLIRKMLPEFVKDLPAVASLIEIKDFPKSPSVEMQGRAIQHMKFNSEGRGELLVTQCVQQDEGMYLVEAPDLIAAMLER